MQLQKLAIHNFRNLSSVVFSPTSGFNLFYGENGAGKTSILEAIHVLSHGRSFRGSSSRELIQYENNSFVVRGVTVDRGRETSLAIERRHSTTIGKLDNEEVTAMSALSAHLPVQTVHPGSFDLLTGEPAHRRAFLDWGLYFADQFFRDQWKKYKRALSQRNAALKKHLSKAEVQSWDSILIESGNYITEVRNQYLEGLLKQLPELADSLGEASEINLSYKQGWSVSKTLEDEIHNNLERDRRLGFTYSGPHRADFETQYVGKDAAKFASRGQIKHVTLLLKLAQSKIFIHDTQKTCLLLLDDLGSELDQKRLGKVLAIVSKLKLQTFITSVEKRNILSDIQKSTKMFHVKHGVVETLK